MYKKYHFISKLAFVGGLLAIACVQIREAECKSRRAVFAGVGVGGTAAGAAGIDQIITNTQRKKTLADTTMEEPLRDKMLKRQSILESLRVMPETRDFLAARVEREKYAAKVKSQANQTLAAKDGAKKSSQAKQLSKEEVDAMEKQLIQLEAELAEETARVTKDGDNISDLDGLKKKLTKLQAVVDREKALFKQMNATIETAKLADAITPSIDAYYDSFDNVGTLAIQHLHRGAGAPIGASDEAVAAATEAVTAFDALRQLLTIADIATPFAPSIAEAHNKKETQRVSSLETILELDLEMLDVINKLERVCVESQNSSAFLAQVFTFVLDVPFKSYAVGKIGSPTHKTAVRDLRTAVKSTANTGLHRCIATNLQKMYGKYSTDTDDHFKSIYIFLKRKIEHRNNCVEAHLGIYQQDEKLFARNADQIIKAMQKIEQAFGLARTGVAAYGRIRSDYAVPFGDEKVSKAEIEEISGAADIERARRAEIERFKQQAEQEERRRDDADRHQEELRRQEREAELRNQRERETIREHSEGFSYGGHPPYGPPGGFGGHPPYGGPSGYGGYSGHA